MSVDNQQDGTEVRDSLLVFPCDFPVKIMGEYTEDFTPLIIEIVCRHDPQFDRDTVEIRASGKGRYLSLTCTVRAHSQAQLDALYRELTGHPRVKIVL